MHLLVDGEIERAGVVLGELLDRALQKTEFIIEIRVLPHSDREAAEIGEGGIRDVAHIDDRNVRPESALEKLVQDLGQEAELCAVLLRDGHDRALLRIHGNESVDADETLELGLVDLL